MASITITVLDEHVPILLDAKEAYAPELNNEQYIKRLLRDDVVKFRRNQLYDQNNDTIKQAVEDLFEGMS